MDLSDNTILDVSNLSMKFGGIVALKNVNFKVKQPSITALIGPNGAGKTTVFNCLTGFYKAAPGSKLRLQGKEGSYDIVKILGEKFKLGDFINPLAFLSRLFYKMFGGTHLVNRAGLARTFQNTRLFKEMSAAENLLVAQHMSMERSLLKGIFKTHGYIESQEASMLVANKWLKFFNLSKSANRIAGELPYGEQKRLEMARAMCTSPNILCLDEPAAGLNPSETKELSEMIIKLRDEYKVTVLIIEHDMHLVMNISDHIVVLNYGEVIFAGKPIEVKNNPKVIAAYLGQEK